MLDVNRLLSAATSRPKSLAAFVGVVWGIVVVGPTRVNPFQVDWLRTGDLTSAYVNLMYFRQSGWFQWPLTALPRYGVGWSTMFNEVGVVPLGLITKALNPVLPSNFQYFGLWAVCCFALQGLFAQMLLSRLKVYGPVLWVGVLLFVTAPILSYRFESLGHHDLLAHWLILLSLYQYFESRLRPYVLGLTLLTALSVNAYIFVIVFSLTLAHLVSIALEQPRSNTWLDLLRAAPKIFGPSAFAYAALGYLSWGGGVVGVGEFRLSLWAFFARDFGGEEFAYLGAGAIVASAIGSAVVVAQRKKLTAGTLPLVLCAALLFLVALSNQIKVGSWLVSYPIPEWVETARQVVRVSNRLSWLLYYLVILVGLLGMERILKRNYRTGLAVLLIVLFSLSIDRVSDVIVRPLSKPATQARWSVLQDSRWKIWQDSIDEVVLYPVFDVQAVESERGQEVLAETRDWVDIIWWTSEKNIPINFAYRSRPVTEFVTKENERLSVTLSAGSFDGNTLYITADRDQWRVLVPLLPPGMDTIFVDGLYVIYPNRATSS